MSGRLAAAAGSSSRRQHRRAAGPGRQAGRQAGLFLQGQAGRQAGLCFCAQGTGVGVYTGSKPLGPFTFRRNIGCGGAVLPAGCGCGMNEDPLHRCPNRYGSSTTHAQQNVVFPIHTSSGVKHIWTGDRWQSSPSGIKAEDRQYWSPLQFSYDEQAQLELPQPLEWVRSFELRIPH
jgi:hypothetical protein